LQANFRIGIHEIAACRRAAALQKAKYHGPLVSLTGFRAIGRSAEKRRSLPALAGCGLGMGLSDFSQFSLFARIGV
jgi:hypothetical protein